MSCDSSELVQTECGLVVSSYDLTATTRSTGHWLDEAWGWPGKRNDGIREGTLSLPRLQKGRGGDGSEERDENKVLSDPGLNLSA